MGDSIPLRYGRENQKIWLVKASQNNIPHNALQKHVFLMKYKFLVVEQSAFYFVLIFYFIYLFFFAGDALFYHNDQRFSTFDKDQDLGRGKHCARLHGGGWWFRYCSRGHLNGKYLAKGQPTTGTQGIIWYYWKGFEYSLKHTEMKIRPN